jgi:hypothetical protein
MGPGHGPGSWARVMGLGHRPGSWARVGRVSGGMASSACRPPSCRGCCAAKDFPATPSKAVSNCKDPLGHALGWASNDCETLDPPLEVDGAVIALRAGVTCTRRLHLCPFGVEIGCRFFTYLQAARRSCLWPVGGARRSLNLTMGRVCSMSDAASTVYASSTTPHVLLGPARTRPPPVPPRTGPVRPRVWAGPFFHFGRLEPHRSRQRAPCLIRPRPTAAPALLILS